MIVITRKQNEPIEKMIKRYKNKFEKNKIREKVLENQRFNYKSNRHKR